MGRLIDGYKLAKEQIDEQKISLYKNLLKSQEHLECQIDELIRLYESQTGLHVDNVGFFAKGLPNFTTQDIIRVRVSLKEQA